MGITLERVDLTGVDFTGADLSRANLFGANLTKTTFIDVCVEQTLFGENLGLSESGKGDLVDRGAIFQEPPSSDVPNLVLR